LSHLPAWARSVANGRASEVFAEFSCGIASARRPGAVLDLGMGLFDRFRVVHYEDTEAVGDFGMRQTRVVRLAAEKTQ